MKTDFKKKRNRSKGFITAEFIFSIVLAVGVGTILFAVTYTLSVVEITQYITFSAARAMIAGDLSTEDQMAAANSKFKVLINAKALKGLYFGDSAMFALPKTPDVRLGTPNGTDFSESYRKTSSPETRVAYSGVRTEITPKILNVRIAFLGQASETGDASEFATKLTTIMTRESSSTECMEMYVNQRYQAIQTTIQRFGAYGSKGASFYIPLEDNGC